MFDKNNLIMNYKLYALLFLSVLTVYSCSTSRQQPLVAEHLTRDTLYLSSQHFDSVYVFRDRLLDRSRDTIYLKDSILEFRYRLLHDTVYKTRVDSIPILREVEVVREVPRPKTWFDRLCRYAFFLLCGALLFFVYRCIRKFI